MPARIRRAALYLRVSTDEQTVDNQRQALTAEAERRGWRIVGEYRDEGISGAKGREQRPGLDACLKDATKGRFNVLMVWALDRLGRSTLHILQNAEELNAAGVDLYIMQQSIDTTSPAGRLFFHIVAAFGEYERDMIRSRVRAGVARKRAAKPDKPWGRRVIVDERVDRARELLRGGMGMNKTALTVGLAKGTVQKIRDEMRSQSRD